MWKIEIYAMIAISVMHKISQALIIISVAQKYNRFKALQLNENMLFFDNVRETETEKYYEFHICVCVCVYVHTCACSLSN